MEIRCSACSRAISLNRRPTTESGVNAPAAVIDGESIQLAMQVEAVPEEGAVEVLAPKGSDQPLDERMRPRHEGDRLQFLDVEDSQIPRPAMKPKQGVMIGSARTGTGSERGSPPHAVPEAHRKSDHAGRGFARRLWAIQRRTAFPG